MKTAVLALLLLLASCTANVTNGSPDPGCDDIEPTVEIELPGDCYEDEDLCPQEVPGKPWEASCGRAYLCEVEQPDGETPYVCVRARDCSCLEAWEECSGDEVEMPGHCGL